MVAESLAAGRPVLTTTGTPWGAAGQPGDGRSEMGDGEDMNLERNGCGVICEVNGLNEALGRMLRFSDEQLDKMGRKGKKMVTERFSWKAAAEAMVDGYKEIGVRR